MCSHCTRGSSLRQACSYSTRTQGLPKNQISTLWVCEGCLPSATKMLCSPLSTPDVDAQVCFPRQVLSFTALAWISKIHIPGGKRSFGFGQVIGSQGSDDNHISWSEA